MSAKPITPEEQAALIAQALAVSNGLKAPSFDQFTVALTEWVNVPVIHRYYAEIFSLYSHHYSATQVGPLLREKIRGKGDFMNTETKNAVITSTHLGVEDHGIFTCYLNLDYGGSGQGFGGYALDKHNGGRNKDSERLGTAYGMEFIRRILATLEVESWEKLPGTHIRVVAQHDKVLSIGHIIKERWFTPDELKTLFNVCN